MVHCADNGKPLVRFGTQCRCEKLAVFFTMSFSNRFREQRVCKMRRTRTGGQVAVVTAAERCEHYLLACVSTTVIYKNTDGDLTPDATGPNCKRRCRRVERIQVASAYGPQNNDCSRNHRVLFPPHRTIYVQMCSLCFQAERC